MLLLLLRYDLPTLMTCRRHVIFPLLRFLVVTKNERCYMAMRIVHIILVNAKYKYFVGDPSGLI